MSTGDGLTALVVDDDAISRRLLSMVLQRRRFRVLTAEDGAAAMAVLAQEDPAVVFLDAHMPPPDGYEVCRRIRERHPGSGWPFVIMVTAAGHDSDRSRALEVGVDEFITKPFSPSKLMVLLDGLQERVRDER